MPHSTKHAKRLLSELALPEDVRRVVQHPSYWDPQFFKLFVDRCEEQIFREPRVGLQLAAVLPDLALLLPEGHTALERLAHREQLARAHAILGGAYRATNQLDQAEKPYRRALKLAQTCSPTIQADVSQRLAILRASQKRFAEASKLAKRAADFFRNEQRFIDLSGALAAQAFALVEARRFSDALAVASEALCYSDPKVNPRVHYSATHNFAYAAIHSSDLDAISRAYDAIREARRQITHHRKSIPKFKLYWVEGILLQKLFATRRAEMLFEKARLGFLELGAVYECAVATLDLSGLLFLDGHWKELEEVAREAFITFCDVEADEETVTALRLWLTAIERQHLESALLANVRETVIGQMVRHRGGG